MTTSTLLTKLEVRAAAVLRCDWCLHTIKDASFSYTPPKGASPDELFDYSCPWCGWRTLFDLAGSAPRERECLRLYFGKADGERFRDERVYAASVWLPYYTAARSWLKSYREAVAERKRIAEVAAGKTSAAPSLPAPRPAPNKREQLRSKALALAQREDLERRALRESAQKFARRMRVREKREHGPYRHELGPKVKALLDDKGRERITGGVWEDRDVERYARRALTLYRAMALCELALWNEVQTETASAVDELEAVVRRFDEVRAEIERDREQRERERREREECERAERERRRAGVLRPVEPVRPAPSPRAPEYEWLLDDETGGGWPPAGPQPVEIPLPSGDSDLAPFIAKWGCCPPPDDGTLAYRRRLAHWKATGEWLPDARLPSSW